MTTKPEREPQTCEAPECRVRFTPQRAGARFCSATCRQRAARARRAVESEQSGTAGTTGGRGRGRAEHGLVKAVRAELGEAGKTETVRGQLALQLARRMSDPNEAGFTAMAKELTKLMDEVLGAAVPGAAEPGLGNPVVSDDEVTRARAARDAKLAAAREAADRT